MGANVPKRFIGVLGKVEPHTTSLMFAMGEKVWFLKGSTANIKIAMRKILQLLEGWVFARSSDV